MHDLPFRKKEQRPREECCLNKSNEEPCKESTGITFRRMDQPGQCRELQHLRGYCTWTRITQQGNDGQSAILPVRKDIMPQIAMHPGRYIEGLPIRLRNILLLHQETVSTTCTVE